MLGNVVKRSGNTPNRNRRRHQWVHNTHRPSTTSTDSTGMVPTTTLPAWGCGRWYCVLEWVVEPRLPGMVHHTITNMPRTHRIRLPY